MSELATFSPFIKGTADHDSLPRIIVAVERDADDTRYFHTVDMNGRFELLSVYAVTVDWRYSPQTETWDDPNASPTPFGDE